MIADGQGRILESMSRKPGTLLPAFPLLVEESGGKRTALRACVLNGLQGPEVYVAKPIYVQNELRALITACFDMRNLLSRAGRPEKFLLFAGPAFSFGDAALSTVDGERRYSGGTSWFGAAGISAAPFLFTVAGGELAPYLEAAWQSYFSDNPDKNLNADFSAGFRFSTGFRYTWKL